MLNSKSIHLWYFLHNNPTVRLRYKYQPHVTRLAPNPPSNRAANALIQSRGPPRRIRRQSEATSAKSQTPSRPVDEHSALRWRPSPSALPRSPSWPLALQAPRAAAGNTACLFLVPFVDTWPTRERSMHALSCRGWDDDGRGR
jgi:hypothetical protein